MCTRLCVEICFYFSSKYLEVKLLSCVVSVYLTLWETAKWFPKRLHNFAFPQEMQRSSSCFISSPNFGATSLFICSHSIGCGTAISHYYFNFASDIEHLFLFPGRLHILCFVTCLIKSFAHLKNWVAYLFFYYMYNFCTYPGNKSFVTDVFCRYLSQSVVHLFISFMLFFEKQKFLFLM